MFPVQYPMTPAESAAMTALTAAVTLLFGDVPIQMAYIIEPNALGRSLSIRFRLRHGEQVVEITKDITDTSVW